ncbi:MAG: shikimate kinase [bacterium]
MSDTTRRNIALLGFMGTGKTTVGRILAEQFGMTFVDMDHVIEERAGKSVARIFAEDGEPHFRALERGLVVELVARTGLVVGAGGGVVLNTDNVRDFERSGLVVCLTAEPAVILGRLAGDSSRPLLDGDEKGARIVKLLESRRALYDAIRHKIDTSSLTPAEVATRIAALV